MKFYDQEFKRKDELRLFLEDNLSACQNYDRRLLDCIIDILWKD